MSQKLTVLIPCVNEAKNIRGCIESVRAVADEILIAASPSTDNMLDIVREAGGCRIIEREWIDASNFRNWAVPQARHPWILMVDADERLTEELIADVREVLRRDDPAFDAYCMRRNNFFLGHPIRHCGWNRTTVIRLFRRECRYGTETVHEHLRVAPGRIGELRGKFLHYTCDSVSQYTQRQNRYTDFWAEERHAAGRRSSCLGIFFRPPARFLQLYFLRGGFLDGVPGLIVCMGSMVYVFLKYAKLWQLSHAGERKA